MNEEILRNIGLTAAEAKIYLTLIELGSTTATKIITQSKLHKSTTYETLERLIGRGLASSVVKGKKRYFQATDPEKLLDIIKERESEIQRILPELKLKNRFAKEKQEITVYEGNEGLKTLLENFIKVKKDVYIIGGTEKMNQILKFFLPNIDRQLIKLKIKLHFMYNEDHRQRGEELKKQNFINLRFIPKEFISPISIAVYGNKSAIIRFTEKPIVVLIENNDTANSFMNYFKLLWTLGKE